MTPTKISSKLRTTSDTTGSRRDISFLIFRYLLENTTLDCGVSAATIESAFHEPKKYGIGWLKPQKLTEKTALAHLRALRNLGSSLPFGVTVKQFGDLEKALRPEGVKDTEWFAQRPLNGGDIRILADALLSTRLDPEDLNELRTNLALIANVKPERLSQGYVNHIEDHLLPGVRRTVEILEQAITEHKTVNFDYSHFTIKGGYDWDNAKPYQNMYPHGLIFKKGIYYFLTSSEPDTTEKNVLNLVIERISNISINEPPKGAVPWDGSDFDFMKYSLERPYMYSGEAKDVELIMKGHLDSVFSTFPNAKVEPIRNQKDTYLVRVRAELTAMKWWILQYSDSIVARKPLELAQKIKTTIDTAAGKYAKLPNEVTQNYGHEGASPALTHDVGQEGSGRTNQGTV